MVLAMLTVPWDFMAPFHIQMWQKDFAVKLFSVSVLCKLFPGVSLVSLESVYLSDNFFLADTCS